MNKKRLDHESIVIMKSRQMLEVPQDLGVILCGSQLCPLDSWFHLLDLPSFFHER